MAREVLDLVQGRMMERNIIVHINENLPTVFGDRQRLVEVLQNLLDNAAKFMGDQMNRASRSVNMVKKVASLFCM